MKFYHIDTFSGIGGFALAAHWVSSDEIPWETVCFVEIDKFCKQVLAKHWPNVPCIDDINDVNAIIKVVNSIRGESNEEIPTNSNRNGLQKPWSEQQTSRSGQLDEDFANSECQGLQGYGKQQIKQTDPFNGCNETNLAKGGDANESHGTRFILTGGFP